MSRLTLTLTGGILQPDQKRAVIRFAAEKNITKGQHNRILSSMGWSEEDWQCGAQLPGSSPGLTGLQPPSNLHQ